MTGRHTPVLLVLIVTPLLVVDTARAGDAPKYVHEFHHDFRGKPLPAELTLFGHDVETYAKEETQGLRFAPPKDRENIQPIGVKTTFSLRGDFEITFALEILHAETPAAGFGVGATLYVNKAVAPAEGVTLGRSMRPPGRDVVVWDRSPGVKNKFEGGDSPCSDKTVRLRLRRVGATWFYEWAPGTQGDAFSEIHHCDFGTDDIKQVVLRCATGGQRCSVDVRFLDLRVRSNGKLAEVVAPVTPTPVSNIPSPTPTRSDSKGWLIAALGVGLAITLLFAVTVALFLVLRQRASSAKEVKK